jgi:hypothetical protein
LGPILDAIDPYRDRQPMRVKQLALELAKNGVTHLNSL